LVLQCSMNFAWVINVSQTRAQSFQHLIQ